MQHGTWQRPQLLSAFTKNYDRSWNRLWSEIALYVGSNVLLSVCVQVASHTTDPEWNSATMIFTGIGKYDADHIVVTVMHKNLSAQSDAELGQAIVDLRTVILSPSIESDAWYMLQQRTGVRHEVSGRRRIECTYFISDSNNIVPGRKDAEDGGDFVHTPNMLVGTIICGRSLHLKGRELVDAYVTLKVGANKHSTAVVRKNCNPHWDHAFKLPISDGSRMITVKVGPNIKVHCQYFSCRSKTTVCFVIVLSAPASYRWLK